MNQGHSTPRSPYRTAESKKMQLHANANTETFIQQVTVTVQQQKPLLDIITVIVSQK